MKLLAIDTAAGPCAACVFDTGSGEVIGREVRDIGKGHAEQLMSVIDAAMRQASIGFAELGAVAVSVGPGSFTGVRVGVAAARGLALALKVPAIGVTTLEAIAADANDDLCFGINLAPAPVKVSQAGQDYLLEEGHACLMLHTEPFEVRAAASNRWVTLNMPRTRLVERLANAEDLLAPPPGAPCEALQFLRRYVVSALGTAARIERAMSAVSTPTSTASRPTGVPAAE